MTDEQWYWDLTKQQAVSASERGPADDLLGPYSTKSEAEHWRERFDERNEAWEQADRDWEGEDDTES